MKAIYWIIAAAAFVFAGPVQAGVNDPEVVIYRFPGVRDDGGLPLAGVATVFACTNFSGATEKVRFVVRDNPGPIKANEVFPVNHLETIHIATHGPLAYLTDNLNTGGMEGTAAIAATSINVICTAMAISASTAAPVGVALRGIRFNPVPGSQE